MASNPVMIELLESGFRDAVVVVVGGTGGVGSEVCAMAAELGARVYSGSRSGRAPAGIPEQNAFPVDVSSPESIRAFCEQVAAACGRVDVLVNCAGSSRQIPLSRVDLLTDELIEQVFTENAMAPVVLMREMLPLLRAGQSPVIVNLSSIAAVTGGGSNLVYASAKAALDTATRAMAKAAAPEVRVVGISPSALDTPFARGRGEDFIDQTIAASALKRIASTREVAVAVLCAARLLTATTGVTVVTDAGRQL